MAYENMDLTHLTPDEKINGIKITNVPQYIREKAYLTDFSETLAQLAEMIIQLGVNLSLDPDEALEWARKLQQALPQSEFDSWVATLLDGGPSIFMNTLSELQTTYPNGAAGVALVRETDPAKIYVWNGTTWDDFGDYQGIEIKDDTISHNKYQDKSISPFKTDFIENTKIFSSIENDYSKFAVVGNIVDDAILTEREHGRTLVMPIEKGKTYKITKEVSDRFRVALSKSEPRDLLDLHPLKDGETSSDSDTSFVFTNEEHNYLYVYVSASYKEPKTVVAEQNYVLNGNVEATNIVKGKNLFDGNYIRGNVIYGATGWEPTTTDSFAIMLNIKPNTYYAISKTPSNRFNVILTSKVVTYDSAFNFDGDDVYEDHREENEVIIRSGPTHKTLIVYVASASTPPLFLQVEEGATATAWETFGYKLSPQAIPFDQTKDSGSRDVLSVEDFRASVDETDSVVIQRAFDSANGKVVSFESGKKYEINKTVTAMASKVRGIKGNNATLILTGDIVGLKYEGTLSGSANPESSNTKELDITEGNTFIERLKVTSKEGHVGTGIRVTKLLNANIESCHTFNLKYGLTIKGLNRNLILSNCHIRDNFQAGLFLDAINLHQLNMTGMHIAYSRNPIYVLDSHIYNWQMVGSDIESNGQDSYGGTESVIHIGKRIGGTSFIRELSFSGLTIQDHNSNTKPMVNIELDENELSYFALGTTHMSNSKRTQPLLYIKGGNRINISNLALKNDGGIDKSLVFGEDVRNLVITGSNIEGEIVYADVQNLIIANNITHGFNLEDTRNENMVISNNLRSTYSI